METKVASLVQWSKEEGVTVSELLGYLLYLDNYHTGDRGLSAVGWKVFSGEKLCDRHEATLEEAQWMIERGALSQAVYLEMRLRFLDRFILPAVMHVTTEARRHRPSLTEYRHGVKAPLIQCLSLTLLERLQKMDLSKLNQDIQVRVEK